MQVPARQRSSHTAWNIIRPALLGCLFGQALPAAAQSLPALAILTEEGDDELRLCQLSYESTTAAARSALRYNQIETASIGESSWYLYINLNALPIRRGGQLTGICAVATQVEIRGNQPLQSRALEQPYFGQVTYCEKGALTVWDSSTAQTTINSNIKGWVDECVAEIEDDIR